VLVLVRACGCRLVLVLGWAVAWELVGDAREMPPAQLTWLLPNTKPTPKPHRLQPPQTRLHRQVAELCRLAFPDKEWLPLVGLIHGLGKLLAHPSFGAAPQWAVAGETYPLGCRFAPQIGHAEFFAANPDRRRRAFSTPSGVYSAGCGLKEVYMSWSAPEYLYLVMVLNQVVLPEEALFIIRWVLGVGVGVGL